MYIYICNMALTRRGIRSWINMERTVPRKRTTTLSPSHHRSPPATLTSWPDVVDFGPYMVNVRALCGSAIH